MTVWGADDEELWPAYVATAAALAAVVAQTAPGDAGQLKTEPAICTSDLPTFEALQDACFGRVPFSPLYYLATN